MKAQMKRELSADFIEHLQDAQRSTRLTVDKAAYTSARAALMAQPGAAEQAEKAADAFREILTKLDYDRTATDLAAVAYRLAWLVAAFPKALTPEQKDAVTNAWRVATAASKNAVAS